MIEPVRGSLELEETTAVRWRYTRLFEFPFISGECLAALLSDTDCESLSTFLEALEIMAGTIQVSNSHEI